MKLSKRCPCCGQFFTPCSPFPKAAADQKFCSRACSNKGNGLARRGRKWGQLSRKASVQAGVAPGTVYVRLTAARAFQPLGPWLIDGMDAFDDVKRAVNRAYARMVEEGRIIEKKHSAHLFPPKDQPSSSAPHAQS
jgi:hypothetical protein